MVIIKVIVCRVHLDLQHQGNGTIRNSKPSSILIHVANHEVVRRKFL